MGRYVPATSPRAGGALMARDLEAGVPCLLAGGTNAGLCRPDLYVILPGQRQFGRQVPAERWCYVPGWLAPASCRRRRLPRLTAPTMTLAPSPRMTRSMTICPVTSSRAASVLAV